MTSVAMPGAAGVSLPGRARALVKRQPRRRRINLALQGGGAHGAFTWGVLDRLLEEPGLELAGISGASAGAMNAAVLADGLAVGGHEGARAALALFWQRVAAEARRSPLAPTRLERATGLAGAGLAAGSLWLAQASRIASPYELNPGGHNPLAAILDECVDFERLRRERPVELFVCATNVRTGKLRVFGPDEVSRDAVLASACLPALFHAVEIEGEHYWDGGYGSNPPVLPLVQGTDCGDTVIVQIDPVRIDELPVTARAHPRPHPGAGVQCRVHARDAHVGEPERRRRPGRGWPGGTRAAHRRAAAWQCAGAAAPDRGRGVDGPSQCCQQARCP